MNEQNSLRVEIKEFVVKKFDGEKVFGDGKLPVEILILNYNNAQLVSKVKLVDELGIRSYEAFDAKKHAWELANQCLAYNDPLRNSLTNAGRNIIAQMIVNSGSPTLFSNANAYIGVGDSNTAFNVAQTDLQAVTNKVRTAMDATYPTIATNLLTFRSTVATGSGNFAWEEWAVFNASSSGTMLQRKVESLGTKTSAQSWQITAALTVVAA